MSGVIYASGFIHAGLTRESDGTPCGVLFGGLQTLMRLGADLKSNTFILCFDTGYNMRKDIYPDYKGNRKDKPREVEVILEQIPAFRDMLQKLGFRNQISVNGYEADDLIAHYVMNAEPDEKVVIVSSDEDMYQLLSKNVRMWAVRKKEWFSTESLMEKYGCTPEVYLQAKIIAGCPTDNVKGVQGVGIKTAVKWLHAESNPKSKTSIKIDEEHKAVILQNKPLIALPFGGAVDGGSLNLLDLMEDDFLSDEDYLAYMRELEFEFMINNIKAWQGFKKGRDVSKKGSRERVSRRMKKKGKKL